MQLARKLFPLKEWGHLSSVGTLSSGNSFCSFLSYFVLIITSVFEVVLTDVSLKDTLSAFLNASEPCTKEFIFYKIHPVLFLRFCCAKSLCLAGGGGARL